MADSTAKFLLDRTKIAVSFAFTNREIGQMLFSAIDGISAPAARGHITLTMPTIMESGDYLVQVACPMSRISELATLIGSFCFMNNTVISIIEEPAELSVVDKS